MLEPKMPKLSSFNLEKQQLIANQTEKASHDEETTNNFSSQKAEASKTLNTMTNELVKTWAEIGTLAWKNWLLMMGIMPTHLKEEPSSAIESGTPSSPQSSTEAQFSSKTEEPSTHNGELQKTSSVRPSEPKPQNNPSETTTESPLQDNYQTLCDQLLSKDLTITSLEQQLTSLQQQIKEETQAKESLNQQLEQHKQLTFQLEQQVQREREAKEKFSQQLEQHQQLTSQLEQQIKDLQRTATIGAIHLDKWRYRTYPNR